MVNMSWRSELGRQIRDARVGQGLTQEKLAEKVGIKQRPLISRYEHGKDAPSVDVLARFADVLDTSFRIDGHELGLVSARPRPAPPPQLAFEFDKEYRLSNATVTLTAGRDQITIKASGKRPA
jgi:transcriptional regulator with XRE-family HTH domain